MKKQIVASILILCSVFAAFAGDVAAFEELGFSADGKYYSFAQYGITDKDFQGYAEIYIVDIAKNDFVKNGKFLTEPSATTKGKSGVIIFDTLKTKNSKTIDAYKFNKSAIEDVLYIKPNDTKSSTESITVTDFEHTTQDNPITYSFTLTPFFSGKGSSLTSSFYISVEKKDKDGVLIEKKVVGNPNVKRAKVSGYAIEKIICSKDAKNFVIIVEKRSDENGTPDVRYMVETFSY